MENDELLERLSAERKKMLEVFASLSIKKHGVITDEFLNMAKNYSSDSDYFFEKKDYIRSFEAVVISWAYIDAGIKAGFFTVSDALKGYFTS